MSRRSLIAVLLVCTFAAGRVAHAGWSQMSSPTTAALYAVAASDANTWVAVGAGGAILRSVDGGVHWTSIASPIGDALRGVSFDGPVGIAAGFGGRVLRTTDAGVTWTEETRPTHKNIYAVSMDARMAVMTGDDGNIFVSIDDGLTWTLHHAGTASILFGVSVAGDNGVGVGGQGAVVMSTDRGTGWGLTILGGQLTFFYATSFATPQTGWATGVDATIGGVIVRSDSSGFTWTAQHAPTSFTLFGVSAATTSSATAVGDAGTILHTEDGGILWAPQSSGVGVTLNGIAFKGSQLAIVVGNGGTILRTTNAGASGAPPAMADGKLAGTAARFSRSTSAPGRIDVVYGIAPCSASKATILYGQLGNYAGYTGCAQADAGNAGVATIDAAALTNVWFNVVWTDGAVAGHPGYGFDGRFDVARTWNAAGFCGITADDHSQATCP